MGITHFKHAAILPKAIPADVAVPFCHTPVPHHHAPARYPPHVVHHGAVCVLVHEAIQGGEASHRQQLDIARLALRQLHLVVAPLARLRRGLAARGHQAHQATAAVGQDLAVGAAGNGAVGVGAEAAPPRGSRQGLLHALQPSKVGAQEAADA